MSTALSTVLRSPDDLIQLVRSRLEHLPEAQRRAALYLINHHARVPFLTATGFAEAAGTSQSSVTRLIANLGFPSYGAFTELVGTIVLGALHETVPVVRFARSSSGTNLADLIDSEVQHLRGLQQVLRSDAFSRSVGHLGRARRVLVAGFGAGASIAVHAQLYLSRVRPDVTLATDLTAPVITQMAHYGPPDRAVVFAVPRHMTDALTLLELLRELGVATILVADHSGTDLAPLATELMIVPVTDGPTTALPVAMFTLSSLLVEGVALLEPDRTMPRLTAFEDMADRSALFVRAQARSRDSWEAQLQDFGASPLGTTDP